MVDRSAVGARAAAPGSRHVTYAGLTPVATASRSGSRHTIPDTWASTSTKTPVETRTADAHEVSKPSVTVVRWSAERIGPTIIAAPQRGHAHVARGAVSVVGVAVAAVGAAVIVGVASTVRASATRATRQVLARNPDWRMRTKPRGRMC
jgi:hypothetical protein